MTTEKEPTVLGKPIRTLTNEEADEYGRILASLCEPAATVPLSEHQRLQAERDALLAEAAAMRTSLFDVAFEVCAEHSWCKLCRTQTPRGSASGREQRELHRHAPHCALSSDAGRALLAERDELRKERQKWMDALGCPHPADRRAPAEAAAERDALKSGHNGLCQFCGHPIGSATCQGSHP